MGLYFSGPVENEYTELYENKIYRDKGQLNVNEYTHIKMLIKNAVDVGLENNLGYFFTVSCLFSHYDGCSICLQNTHIKLLPIEKSTVIEAKLFFEIVDDIMKDKRATYTVGLHTMSSQKGYYLVSVINNH